MTGKRPNEPIGPTNVPGQPLDPGRYARRIDDVRADDDAEADRAGQRQDGQQHDQQTPSGQPAEEGDGPGLTVLQGCPQRTLHGSGWSAGCFDGAGERL